jgi:hypothetical protein
LKYWRGYLVAAIVAAGAWGLMEFAQSHGLLVDMIYPYMSRIIQTFLTDWSSAVPFCLWQLLVLVMIVGALATAVMMIIWKWNPIQWFGWVVAAVSIVFFLNTALFGLNAYAGSLAQDLRLDVSDYTIGQLEEAAEFYLERANTLSSQINRDGSGEPQFPDFATLAQQAAEGFENQTYEEANSIFAGSLAPVKELGWKEFFTARGITGLTVGVTGEAAVNPNTPALGLPFAISREMAKRMCIYNDQDASFAAFLACSSHSDVNFQYSAYFMAYRYCFNALADMDTSAAQIAAQQLQNAQSSLLTKDLASYNSSFAVGSDFAYAEIDPEAPADSPVRSNVADLLTAWHLDQYVLPFLEEEEALFDPMDETQVDLSGLPYGPEPTEEAEESQ